MSVTDPGPARDRVAAEARGLVVRAAAVETVVSPPQLVSLLADGSDTGGLFSVVRVDLSRGADGPSPHSHDGFAELIYILEGEVDVLCGDQLTVARAGDLVIAPPTVLHAFGATAGNTASLFAVIAPGIDRHEYFRHLARVATGQVPADDLAEVSLRYGSRLADSPAWARVRRR
jgi:quercetin dioxygenase-like cupin family protein